MTDNGKAVMVLVMNTLAFMVCFAAWMMNGVLITFLVDNGVFDWDRAQMGWLIGIPVLTGSVTRLPVGILTDKYGGRVVYATLMLLSAIPMYLVSYANSYYGFLLAGLGFGLTGASFAVGIAYTSVWFKKERQGTALGIFGAGNAGAALTSMGAPIVLRWLTDGGVQLDAWRTLPKIYALALALMAVVFYLLTHTKKAGHSEGFTLMQRLQPLRHMRVWRFGAYYFLVFGGFVALAQWLIPYYVNVYAVSVGTAGLLAAIFSLPSGVIRALGGWLSDHYGARKIMYWVLGSCVVCCALLVVPKMDIQSPGQGVTAFRNGEVTGVSENEIAVDQQRYSLRPPPLGWRERLDDATYIIPAGTFWQEPVVKVGDQVKKKELLAKGVTHLYFQANIWIFTGLVFIVGIMMGIGKAAVYKHIPDYFPDDVGVVGGIVGVVGGLGGFFCPIFFGYMLKGTGIWTTCWIFFTLFSVWCLWWMHRVVQRMMHRDAPNLMLRFEDHSRAVTAITD